MNLDNSVYYQDFKDLIKLFEIPNKTKDISTVINIATVYLAHIMECYIMSTLLP